MRFTATYWNRYSVNWATQLIEAQDETEARRLLSQQGIQADDIKELRGENSMTVEEFYSVDNAKPWCILDNEAEYVVGRFATREEAEAELTNRYALRNLSQ